MPHDYRDRTVAAAAAIGCTRRLKRAMIFLQHVEEKFQIAFVLAAAEFAMQSREPVRDRAFVNPFFAQRLRKPSPLAARVSVFGRTTQPRLRREIRSLRLRANLQFRANALFRLYRMRLRG